MSSVRTNTCPSHSATPRFATIPKLRKTATLSGVQRHLTSPVVAFKAKTLSSFVVTYSVPFDSTGYDCSPRLILASIAWKSTVKRRPSLLDVVLRDLASAASAGSRRACCRSRASRRSAPADGRADADVSSTHAATAATTTAITEIGRRRNGHRISHRYAARNAPDKRISPSGREQRQRRRCTGASGVCVRTVAPSRRSGRCRRAVARCAACATKVVLAVGLRRRVQRQARRASPPPTGRAGTPTRRGRRRRRSPRRGRQNRTKSR